MSVKDTLVKAKGILVERGVNRNGQYLNEETGCLCAFGAVFAATGVQIIEDDGGFYFDWSKHDLNASDDAGFVLVDALEAMTNGSKTLVTTFNDTSTSDQEVLDLFDRAIASTE